MILRGFRIAIAAAVLLAATVTPREALPQDGPSSKPDPLLIKDFLYEIDRGIKYGPVAVHAYLSEYLSYNDNLMLT